MNPDELDLSLRADVAADHLLDLVGEVAKLAVMLAELSEEEITAISGRIGAFFGAIDALPVKQFDPANWNDNVGQA